MCAIVLEIRKAQKTRQHVERELAGAVVVVFATPYSFLGCCTDVLLGAVHDSVAQEDEILMRLRFEFHHGFYINN